MAAPVATARGTPAGIYLKNGYSTKITFAANPTIEFWEKTVKPSAQMGPPMIDISTMHNVTKVTKYPGALVEDGSITGKAAYDPAVKSSIDLILNVPTTITITYPDGTAEANFGALNKVEYDELQRNTLPELSYTIEMMNYDYVNKVEAGRTIVSVPGT